MGDHHLVHCSSHKCLTVYYKRVMHSAFNRCLPWSAGYRHFNSHLENFYLGFAALRIASVNNRAPDLERLERFRVSRFVRDPRDLVVSGYFYHLRGAEAWTTEPAPTAESWYFANGKVPEGVRSAGTSFASYLCSVSKEDGLLAELEFREHHFEAMAAWPTRHPDILTLAYEEILGAEARAFRRLASFYGLSPLERLLVHAFAKRYSLRRLAPDAHVRDPSAGQWREHFTPRLREVFDERYAGLVEALGYPPTVS